MLRQLGTHLDPELAPQSFDKALKLHLPIRATHMCRY